MLRLSLAFLVAQSSALALQPVCARSAAAARSAAVVRSMRSAAAMMSDPDATRDSEDGWASAELLARLRSPIRQYDGGWADTATRYGGKKQINPRDAGNTHYGTGGGRRLEDDTFSADAGSTALPPEKQALLVLPEESFKISKMEMSQTDEDFVLECALDENQMEAEMFIDIEPMFLTKEEYFFGFTADSDPKISIEHGMSSEIQGELNAKEHASDRGSATMGSLDGGESKRGVMIKLKFKPEFAVGEFDAYLCFIFPNEPAFSKFYKITGKSTSA